MSSNKKPEEISKVEKPMQNYYPYTTPDPTCEHCGEKKEYSKGKWNDNCGHVECFELGNPMILCYDCHGKFHYNK